MDPILDTITEALKRKGLTDSAASKLAVGHPSLIKNLKMPREGEKRYNLPALMKLAKILDLEFYFGPKRETAAVNHMSVGGDDFAHIPIHEATLSAGPGALNGDDGVIDHLIFRTDWLQKIGVKEQNAAIARIVGDSMAPGIKPGDLVLIDTSKTSVPIRKRTKGGRSPAPIYAFVQDGEARVKRIDRPDSRLLVLLSDNPNFPVELVTEDQSEDLNILGQVIWSGHVWR